MEEDEFNFADWIDDSSAPVEPTEPSVEPIVEDPIEVPAVEVIEPEESPQEPDFKSEEPIVEIEPKTTQETVDEELEESIRSGYKFLVDNGVLDEEEEFDGSIDSFKALVSGSKAKQEKAAMDNIWNELATTLEESEDTDSYLVDLEGLDLNDETVQQEVMAQDLRQTTQLSEERIERLVNMATTAGTLDVEANTALDSLKQQQEDSRTSAIETAKHQVKAKEDEAKQHRQAIDDAIKTSETIKGKRKSTIRNFMTNKVKRDDEVSMTDWNRKLVDILSSPTDAAELANYVYEWEKGKGFNNDKIVRMAGSKRTTKYEESIKESFPGKGSKSKANTLGLKSNDSDFMSAWMTNN